MSSWDRVQRRRQLIRRITEVLEEGVDSADNDYMIGARQFEEIVTPLLQATIPDEVQERWEQEDNEDTTQPKSELECYSCYTGKGDAYNVFMCDNCREPIYDDQPTGGTASILDAVKKARGGDAPSQPQGFA